MQLDLNTLQVQALLGIAAAVGFAAITVIARLRVWKRLLRILSRRTANPKTTSRIAKAAAETRINAMAPFAETVSAEFLEGPDGENVSRREFSFEDGVAQIVRLKWERRHPAFLLLGRVADALIYGARKQGVSPSNVATRISLVALSPFDRLFGSFGKGSLFNFKVIVETNNRRLVKSLLGEWPNLGVGVELEPSIKGAYFGMCSEGGTTTGIVGGYLERASEDVGVTCAHVVSDRCKSARYRANLRSGVNNSPDIALLTDRSPCFVKANASNKPVGALNLNDPAQFHGRHVAKHPSNRASGKIERTCSYAAYDDRVHRFPHVIVAPLMMRWHNIFEFTPRRFSRPGDSGSWVLTTDEHSWVGVVTGGHEGLRTTDVIEGDALLDYISHLPGFADVTGAYVEEM